MSAHNQLQQHLIAPHEIIDPGDAGDVQIDRSPASLIITTQGAETRTIPSPQNVGQRLTICLSVDGGDLVVDTENPINVAGNDTMTFDTAGDTIVLEAVMIGPTYNWRVVANDGVALS